MRKIVHDFLKWAPVALGAGAIAIAGVWEAAKDWIAGQAVWAWSKMSDPWIAAFVVLAVLAYIAAIIWAGGDARQARAQTANSSKAGAKKEDPHHVGQLYIYENADKGVDKLKGYIAVWSPTQHLRPLFSDYKTYSGKFPHPRKGEESALTLHLLNAGPGDIRTSTSFGS
jgi:hypothetical protein